MTKAKKTKQPGDYTVGYGKPPAHSQFKPGQSGNKKGRAQKPASIQDIFAKELKKKVAVKVGEKIEEISKKEVFVKKLIHSAIDGKVPAMRMVLDLIASEQAAQGAEQAQSDESDVDIKISDDDLLRVMLERIEDSMAKQEEN